MDWTEDDTHEDRTTYGSHLHTIDELNDNESDSDDSVTGNLSRAANMSSVFTNAQQSRRQLLAGQQDSSVSIRNMAVVPMEDRKVSMVFREMPAEVMNSANSDTDYDRELDLFYKGQEVKINRLERKMCIQRMALALFVAISLSLAIFIAVKKNQSGGTSSTEEMLTHANNSSLSELNEVKSLCESISFCYLPLAAGEENLSVKKKNKVCERYHSLCNALYVGDINFQEEVAQYSEILNKVCEEDTIRNDPQQFLKCQAHCAPNMCCFNDDSYDNCEPRTKGECENYSACRILHDDDFLLVEETCSLDSLRSNDGYGACQRFCSNRACCFLSSDRYNCYASGLDWCSQFMMCKNLVNVQPQD